MHKNTSMSMKDILTTEHISEWGKYSSALKTQISLVGTKGVGEIILSHAWILLSSEDPKFNQLYEKLLQGCEPYEVIKNKIASCDQWVDQVCQKYGMTETEYFDILRTTDDKGRRIQKLEDKVRQNTKWTWGKKKDIRRSAEELDKGELFDALSAECGRASKHAGDVVASIINDDKVLSKAFNAMMAGSDWKAALSNTRTSEDKAASQEITNQASMVHNEVKTDFSSLYEQFRNIMNNGTELEAVTFLAKNLKHLPEDLRKSIALTVITAPTKAVREETDFSVEVMNTPAMKELQKQAFEVLTAT